MDILLLDMDNVLLKPYGYRYALREATRAVSTALGYQSPDFHDDVIERLEANGVTSEWEMVAITAAILLAALPEAQAALPDQLDLNNPVGELNPTPPILPTFDQIAELDPQRSPLDRAAEILLEHNGHLRPGHLDEIRSTLNNARTLKSVIYRTIQELVMGSADYQASYNLEPVLDVDGYLHQYDQPLLSPAGAQCLHSWRKHVQQEAVIFTNRPSTPPPGHFDTPEAEIGAALVDLDGYPIIGSGDLGWLASQDGERPDRYLKPSGVHALSALLLASGIEKAEAMLIARALTHGEAIDRSRWEGLNGSLVTVFEDSAKGFHSALNAQKALRTINVSIQIQLVGIGDHPAKQNELIALDARVFPNINQAFRFVLPDCETHTLD